MAQKNVLLTVGTGETSVDFIVRGNPEVYLNLGAIASVGFVAKEATASDNAKTLGVITPTTALLASGAFERVDLSSKDGKSRTAIVPSNSVSKIKNTVQADGGLSIAGITATSVSSGLRRKSR
jgi:hypothetical protein